MSAIQPMPTVQALDLTVPPPLSAFSRRLLDLHLAPSIVQDLEVLTMDEHPRNRSRQLAEVVRKLDTAETVNLFRAAGKSSLRLQSSGLRFLFGFLEVKRPGVEVLRQIETLSSFERVALRIISGTWKEPEESADSDSVFAILDVLDEASRVGVLELGLDNLPGRPTAIQTLVGHVRRWFVEMRQLLEAGGELAEPILRFLTQLSMLEIALIEKRVSRIAETIDPYDVRDMGRLLPVLSRYDQDIAHMKSVVSRIITYRPFQERLLTMEHTLSSNEMDKLVRALYKTEETTGLAHLLVAVRRNPILDRRLSYLVSVAHQVGVLRAARLEGDEPPDIHSTMLQVALANTREDTVHLRMEKEIAEALWPTVEGWGMARLGPDGFQVPYREERSGDFVQPDGTPRLPEQPQEHEEKTLDLKQLIRTQMQNDIFLLGILDNGRAVNMPGVVGIIAENTRSLRVLDKICRQKHLYTGAANKHVPTLLLRNPSRIPMNYLRRFINVRFVSKVDLRQMARAKGTLRNEVSREITGYLASLTD